MTQEPPPKPTTELAYGTPGVLRSDDRCRECWGERWVWLGNAWGLQHSGAGLSDCKHECHKDEIWMAGESR